ncbi:MAG: MmgE/PrpD family protein [Candidatus Bathyarchaeia archaeon]
MGKDTKEYTKEVANYVKDLEYKDVPHGVVQQAKIVLMDTIGVMLAASSPRYLANRVMIEFVKRLGGKGEATVVGSDFKTSCVNAALANGTMANNIELDDSHPKSGAHVAAVIIPSALAIGEREKVDGKKLITSLIVGYDVDVRVVLGLNPSSLYKRGFHPSAIGGCFGSMATAGKILDLDLDALIRGFGLAGSQASGLMAWETDPTQMPKSFQMGLAASNGIRAALLAQGGFSGPPAIFEGRYGVFGAFSDEYNLNELTEDLGKRFEITLTGLKRYACCKFLHASLDSFLGIMHEHDLDPEEIDEIIVRIPPPGVPIINNNDLISHNAQYIIAVAAFDRSVTVDHIYEDRRVDSKVSSLSRRIKVVGDPELAKVFPGFFSEPAVVEVLMKNGERFLKRTDHPKGDPGNPLNKKEVENKFLTLSKTVIDEEDAMNIMGMIDDLENVEDISELCDMLRR